jgi:hypothetical protein
VGQSTNLPPEVETGEAKEVKATTATITGTVEREGLATSYWFEYGLTTAYGTKVPLSPTVVGAGFTPVAVSQALTGLAQATTYHCRLVVESSAGSHEARRSRRPRLGGRRKAECAL